MSYYIKCTFIFLSGPMEPTKPSNDSAIPKTNSDTERKLAFRKELCGNVKKVKIVVFDRMLLQHTKMLERNSFPLYLLFVTYFVFLDLDWHCDNVSSDFLMGCNNSISESNFHTKISCIFYFQWKSHRNIRRIYRYGRENVFYQVY